MSGAELIERLPRASLEGTVFVLAIWLICRMAPRLRARHRATLWWLAGAKMLFALVPIAPLALAVLPPAPPAVRLAWTGPGGTPHPTVEAPSPGRTAMTAGDWAVAVWGAGVIALFCASLPGLVRARAWRRSGRPAADPALAERAATAAHAVGLRCVPDVRLVPGLPGPLVVGLFRPAVLLPDDAPERLSPNELGMALEHEMAHVARRDLWLGLVPAAARRVFFFHPLAWLAEREYAIAREAACDEAVVSRDGADILAYGRLLLTLSAARPTATATLSPRSVLRRRLEMMESTVRRAPLGARAAWALLAVATIAFVPMRLVAREAPVAPEAPAAPPAPEAQPAPVAEAAPATAPTPATAPVAVAGTPAPTTPRPTPTARRAPVGQPAPPAEPPPAPAAAPTPAVAPRAPATPPAMAPPATAPPPAPAAAPPTPAAEATPPPPMARAAMRAPRAPVARAARYEAAEDRCLDLDGAPDTSFVIIHDDTRTMCGDMRDVRRANRARNGNEDLIWFRVDGQDWVIRNPSTIAQALQLYRPEADLDRKMEELGAMQEQLGRAQEILGEEQAKLSDARGALGDERQEKPDRKVDAELEKISQQLEEISRQLERLDREMTEVDAAQNSLAGESSAHAAEAQSGISNLLRDAMANGVAHRLL